MDWAVYLRDWFITYLKNKDLFKNEIVSVKHDVEGFDFVVHYKNKDKFYVIVGNPAVECIQKLLEKENVGLVFLSNKDTIRFVCVNWKQLKSHLALQIFFVNPLSNNNTVWSICPNIHDRISELGTLDAGLHALAEFVDPVGVEEFSKRLQEI